MQFVLDFLSANPMLAICLCLALGYCIGMVRIKTFAFGATIGTLVVGFGLSRLTTFEIPDILLSVFLLLFCFAIGYEAGPAFFESLRSSGIKYVLHAIVFAISAFAVLFVFAKCNILDRDSLIGLAAGALTQTSILTVVEGLGSGASVAYAITYTTGTLLPIIFITVLAPKMLRTSPILAAKNKLAKSHVDHTKRDEMEQARLAPVYPRAFRLEASSAYVGKTVELLEDAYEHSLQVVKCFRGEEELSLSQSLVLEAGDVVTVISAVRHMVVLDDETMTEVCDDRYLALKISTKEIIITEDCDTPLLDLLSTYGLVLHTAVSREGKKLRITEDLTAKRGMVIRVSGVDNGISKLATTYGYVKEIGTATDVPFVFSALALAIIFGAFKILGFGLGDSTCALLIGLVCGWFCNKNPKYGTFPESTRWFVINVGLNLFIAAKALSTGYFAFDKTLLIILSVGAAVTLLPHILTLIFCRFVLKMDDADNLGGLCGSGTVTPALNGLIDASGSSVFTASYATTNAVANILLTVLGILLAAVI